MDTLTGIGLLVAGGLLLLMNKKDDSGPSDGKVNVKDAGKGIGDGAYPVVPTLTPPDSVCIKVVQSMMGNNAAFQVPDNLKSGPGSLYPLIFADQLFLYQPAIEKDFSQLAGWLVAQGMSTALLGVIQDRINGTPIGETLIQFDKGLPAELRGYTFWKLAAGRLTEVIQDAQTGELAKYPKFATSVMKLATGNGVVPVGTCKAAGTGVTDFPNGSMVDKDNPLTWGLADADGPTVVQTPKGPLTIPKGGQIRKGLPIYYVQNGDGGKIAQNWGKPYSWNAAVAHENPQIQNWSNVYAGTKLSMPILFLDPAWTYDYAPKSSGQNVPPPVSDPGDASGDAQYGPPAPSYQGGGYQGGGNGNPPININPGGLQPITPIQPGENVPPFQGGGGGQSGGGGSSGNFPQPGAPGTPWPDPTNQPGYQGGGYDDV